MQQYVFPAVFIKNGDESFSVLVPDLNITTDGDTIEEAYLYIKDYLRVFCEYAVKMNEEIILPTKYETICEKFKKDIVMLIDAVV
ncbi:MAG: type II toxin-antitoxin system HicB family antitoxin [Firmicutes bacterium]|nr:type II toxin-antitoxin system HicB family antitoxin [Bacillota bacterium]